MVYDNTNKSITELIELLYSRREEKHISLMSVFDPASLEVLKTCTFKNLYDQLNGKHIDRLEMILYVYNMFLRNGKWQDPLQDGSFIMFEKLWFAERDPLTDNIKVCFEFIEKIPLPIGIEGATYGDTIVNITTFCLDHAISIVVAHRKRVIMGRTTCQPIEIQLPTHYQHP